MKKHFFLYNFAFILILLAPKKSFGQVLLNGDFENNSANSTQLNIPNTQYNSFMMDSKAFGSFGNMDIIDSNLFCGSGAQNGNWYVGITGGDSISLKLSDTLIQGNTYHISFYDRFPVFDTPESHPFHFGLSQSDTTFGTIIYTASLADTCSWTQKNFSFVAPNNGQFITIGLASGLYYETWLHLDNVVFTANLSLGPEEDGLLLSVYPNPFTSYITISGLHENTDVYIYNSLGEQINSWLLNSLNATISVEDLCPGIYFIEAVNTNGKVIRKIVKKN